MTQRHLARGFSQLLTLRCIDPWGGTSELEAEFGYVPSDPYAVSVTFRTGDAEVPWMVSRELLFKGLTDPCGSGDVRVSPAIDEVGSSVTRLEFASPDGYLQATASTRQLFGFLTRTIAVVPLGEESVHLDLDGLVQGLIS